MKDTRKGSNAKTDTAKTTHKRDQAGEIHDKGRLQVLLIDDDEMFGKVLKRTAKRQDVELEHCKSLEEFSDLANIRNYDVIQLDYHLGTLKGSTIAGFLNIFFPAVPVIITSVSSEWWHRSGANYPACVRYFLHKEHQPKEIIDTAVRLAHEDFLENSGLAEVEVEAMEAYDEYAWHAPRQTGRRHLYLTSMAKLGHGILNIASGIIPKGKF